MILSGYQQKGQSWQPGCNSSLMHLTLPQLSLLLQSAKGRLIAAKPWMGAGSQGSGFKWMRTSMMSAILHEAGQTHLGFRVQQ